MAVNVTLNIPPGCCPQPECQTCQECFGDGYSDTYPAGCADASHYVDTQNNGRMTCYKCMEGATPCGCTPCTSGGNVTISVEVDYLCTVTIHPDGTYSHTGTAYGGSSGENQGYDALNVVISGCTQGVPAFSSNPGVGDEHGNPIDTLQSADGCTTVVVFDDTAPWGSRFHQVTLNFPAQQ